MMNGINPISGDHGLINTDNGLIPLITLLNGGYWPCGY